MQYYVLRPYRYRLAEAVSIRIRNRDLVDALRQHKAIHPYFAVEGDSVTAAKNYAWDGASYVLMQTKDLIVPSLVHDIGCQAVNMELLPREMRPLFDREYLLQCEAYKVPELRRGVHYRAIRVWGMIPKHEGKISPYERVHEIPLVV